MCIPNLLHPLSSKTQSASSTLVRRRENEEGRSRPSSQILFLILFCFSQSFSMHVHPVSLKVNPHSPYSTLHLWFLMFPSVLFTDFMIYVCVLSSVCENDFISPLHFVVVSNFVNFLCRIFDRRLTLYCILEQMHWLRCNFRLDCRFLSGLLFSSVECGSSCLIHNYLIVHA